MSPTHLFWLLLCLKWIQKNIVDPLLDLFFGYSTKRGWRSEQESSHKYGSSAQVVKIWFRAHYSPATLHGPVNFLYTHQKYVHPREVLKSDNITLHGVNSTHAWFCVSPPNIDVYDLKMFPFAWVAQFLMAQQLIIMPLWALNQLADELPTPGGDGKEVIVLANTARCGSTLLCQMFNNLPNTRSMSEPWALCKAHTYYVRGKISNEDGNYERLIKSILTLQCKDEKSRDVKRIFLKPPVWCTSQFPLMKKVCPGIKPVFITRHPKPSVVSFYKMATGPVFVESLKAELPKLMQQLTPLPYHDPTGSFEAFRVNTLNKCGLHNLEQFCAMACGVALLCYGQDKPHYVDTIVYEDLIKDPEERTSALFKKLDLPLELVPLALTALDKDSQQKFFGNTDGREHSVFTEQMWTKVEAIFEELKIPLSHKMSLEAFTAFINEPRF